MDVCAKFGYSGRSEKRFVGSIPLRGEQPGSDKCSLVDLKIKILALMFEVVLKVDYYYRLGAGVAQLVEQLICNQPVGGSTPLASSNKFKEL